jgi:eukaryotic-like serine/threonine-protein kinase
MPFLSPGSQLGPYEIVGAIGAGGMGQVYRARDTRLGRTVAIKVLSSEISNHTELRDRFEREAQTISNLNHPHICILHDVGRHDDIDYLVMEYLEGETLAQRLERGAIPAKEAMRIAIEIGDALDKAHRQGIIHRDLKPGNVMLTKNGAKLLDFGLAKLRMSESPVPVSVSAVPTDLKNLTAAGTILGTLQYMSPEQLEGKEADTRSDIFAFGTTFYEMVTGKKAFQGKTQVSLMAAILEHDPPAVTSIQPIAPSGLDAIVAGCLTKDPEERWQTARDVVRQLKALEQQPEARPAEDVVITPSRRSPLAWIVICAVLAITGIVVGTRMGRQPLSPAPLVRFAVPPPDEGFFTGAQNVPRFAVSLDGKFLAFEASSGAGKPYQIWIRRLDSGESQPLSPVATDTNAIQSFFWSPDSRYIGFFDEPAGKMKKIDIQGGPAQTIFDVAGNQYGGTWNAQGVILFSSTVTNGLQRVSANGGTAVQVTTLDKSQQETAHLWPQFLPDGRHFLYQVQKGTRENWSVYVGSLDSNDRKMLIQSEYSAEIAPPNVLLYMRGETLFAQTVDLRTFELTGEPVLIAESVGGTVNGRPGFHASNSGLVVYGSGTESSGGRALWWVDRSGKRSEPLGAPLNGQTLRLAPDGTRIALSDTTASGTDIWIHDAARNIRSRLTTDAAPHDNPIWSPDGSQIIFNSTRDGISGLYEKASSGATAERLLYKSEAGTDVFALDWSRDARFVLFAKTNPKDKNIRDLWVLPLASDQKPYPYLATGFDKYNAALSADGRWLAYSSKESGMYQVVVQPFPDASAGKWQISAQGGMKPRWRADGKEIYYLDRTSRIIAVSVTADQKFAVGKANTLFQTALGFQALPNTTPFDVAPDGQRFMISEGRGARVSNNPAPLQVILNWPSLLKQ